MRLLIALALLSFAATACQDDRPASPTTYAEDFLGLCAANLYGRGKLRHEHRSSDSHVSGADDGPDRTGAGHSIPADGRTSSPVH
jgi:hypothetical protein